MARRFVGDVIGHLIIRLFTVFLWFEAVVFLQIRRLTRDFFQILDAELHLWEECLVQFKVALFNIVEAVVAVDEDENNEGDVLEQLTYAVGWILKTFFWILTSNCEKKLTLYIRSNSANFYWNCVRSFTAPTTLKTGMEITGIASQFAMQRQFAMQSRPICDASSHMRRNNCDALLGYSTLIF